MRKTFPLLLFLLILAVPQLRGETYSDAMARQVTIPATPDRIISLVPSVTEILFALGADRQLVAVTDYCTYPPAARALPSIGSYAEPALENLLRFKPDLIFAAADMNRPTLIQQLETLGIPVYVVYPRTVDETLETIRQIGTITGTAPAARQLVATIEAKIQKLGERLAPLPVTSTLACVMLQPLTVAGPQTFINDLIRLAGGRNSVPAGPSRYPTWNIEALLSVDPEVIIVPAHPGQPDPRAFFSSWPQLRAVRSGRIVTLEADWIHRPGPRMVLGIEALANALHPEITE